MSGSYLENLLHSEILRAPVLRRAARAMDLSQGSKGLDAGCGIGLQCKLLAEAVGEGGHVTGIDQSIDFVRYGTKWLEKEGWSQRISLIQGSIEKLPFEDDTFDWAWSVDCVGYGPWDAQPMLEELRRVIRPGGCLALLAWSSERLLPGYPGFEARLGATSVGMAPFSESMEPERHVLRLLGKLRVLGLDNVRAEAFVGSVHAPLDKDSRKAMKDLLEMRWQGAEKELSPDDQAEFVRLCHPESPDFILDHPDYFAFYTYSMFHGIVP